MPLSRCTVFGVVPLRGGASRVAGCQVLAGTTVGRSGPRRGPTRVPDDTSDTSHFWWGTDDPARRRDPVTGSRLGVKPPHRWPGKLFGPESDRSSFAGVAEGFHHVHDSASFTRPRPHPPGCRGRHPPPWPTRPTPCPTRRSDRRGPRGRVQGRHPLRATAPTAPAPSTAPGSPSGCSPRWAATCRAPRAPSPAPCATSAAADAAPRRPGVLQVRRARLPRGHLRRAQQRVALPASRASASSASTSGPTRSPTAGCADLPGALPRGRDPGSRDGLAWRPGRADEAAPGGSPEVLSDIEIANAADAAPDHGGGRRDARDRRASTWCPTATTRPRSTCATWRRWPTGRSGGWS